MSSPFLLTAGRSALRTGSSCSLKPVSLVAAQRTRFKKADVHVYLLRDVESLGEKGEIVQVDRRLMRSVLQPYGVAYYVPTYFEKPVLPEGWQTKLKEVELEKITPALWTEELESLAAAEEGRHRSAQNGDVAKEAQAIRAEMDVRRREALLQLGSLQFDRVRISASSQRIYGSVAAEDVVAELGRRGIQVDRQTVDVPEGKIKEIGTHKIMVRLEAGDVEMEVVVAEFGSNQNSGAATTATA
ncbi:hypothetical protein HK104_000094 [Borealophlyctis nickersoniae]|nr:hypothetical protein HK104_000094 [Borealophlyctis nickersoniae]